MSESVLPAYYPVGDNGMPIINVVIHTDMMAERSEGRFLSHYSGVRRTRNEVSRSRSAEEDPGTTVHLRKELQLENGPHDWEYGLCEWEHLQVDFCISCGSTPCELSVQGEVVDSIQGARPGSNISRKEGQNSDGTILGHQYPELEGKDVKCLVGMHTD